MCYEVSLAFGMRSGPNLRKWLSSWSAVTPWNTERAVARVEKPRKPVARGSERGVSGFLCVRRFEELAIG